MVQLTQGRLLVGMIACSILVSACTLQQDVASAPPSGKTGFSAPTVSGTTLAGKGMTIVFRGHRTVLIFWASWCGPCRHEQPYVTRMATDLAAEGVVQEFHVPYPSLYDPDGKLAAAYQVDSPPAKVLVDGRGVIAARVDGETTEDMLERLIQAKLLGG